jgi:protoporphyrin/coproporphyrin ferrochelatase
MKIGILVLNSGEPEKRSPLNAQSKKQTRMLEGELRRRRYHVDAYLGLLNGRPKIAEAVSAAHREGVERVAVLPLFPICEQTTTITALDAVQAAMANREWEPAYREITDWHRHPDYYRIQADNIRAYSVREGLELHSTETTLLFAASGTAKKHLKSGPRYVAYVEEVCRGIARELGRSDYVIGYQTPADAKGPWTSPTIGAAIKKASGRRLLVVPVSHMEEQLATLRGLDKDLRKAAEKKGLTYYRAPIPHESVRFVTLLADLVEDLLRPEPIMGDLNLRRCLCRGTIQAFCLNAAG